MLASDAAHFYANLEQGRPFPILDNVTDYLEAHRKIRKLAASDDHVIPGHDPEVLMRYPLARVDVPDIVRVDLPIRGKKNVLVPRHLNFETLRMGRSAQGRGAAREVSSRVVSAG